MIILIVAGILAALCLFRWARTLALFAIAAIVIMFIIQSHGARSEEVQPVLCRIGSYQIWATKGDCPIIEAGRAKIQIHDLRTIELCSQFIIANLGVIGVRPQMVVSDQCQRMWEHKMEDIANSGGKFADYK